ICIIDSIIPDLPFEEKDELSPFCDKYEIDLISLIAPTSNERISMIAKEAKGFVYCVSSLGVTGVRSEITTDVNAMTNLVRQSSDIPCAIGFGISTPEQAAKMSKAADGVIVGSAIVKIVAQYGKDCIEPVKEYVKSMKEAIIK
ncbi:MAG: tryptophan synthase subunit alpha, partial [Lachnospiraceae bacterium]|nr:tryptophan synthase subunit alpha [Lachnospiraceae bacterium]